MTVEGGKLRKPRALAPEGDIAAGLPAPGTPDIAGHYGVFIAGVGGTGVVTIGQLIGMAAHLEGKGCSVLDMAGLAQKGGAVYSHVVLAPTPGELMNTRVAMGEADLVLAGDLVVGTSQEAVARMRPDRTRALVNTDVAPTAAFVHNPDWTCRARTCRATWAAPARRCPISTRRRWPSACWATPSMPTRS